jgi:hypothetical protein
VKLTDQAMSYGGTTAAVTVPPRTQPAPPAPSSAAVPHQQPSSPKKKVLVTEAVRTGNVTFNGHPTLGNGLPDFARMDVNQRLAYHRQRLGLDR